MVALVLLVIDSYAQQKISGKLFNTEGEVLPYAHIKLINSNLGTISNSSGDFFLYFSENVEPIVKISCIGYKTQQIRLVEENQIIVLREDIRDLIAVKPNYL